MTMNMNKSARAQEMIRRMARLAESAERPLPRISPLPVFSIHADTVATYRRCESYTDGLECVLRRAGQLVAWCVLHRGWYVGDPLVAVRVRTVTS